MPNEAWWCYFSLELLECRIDDVTSIGTSDKDIIALKLYSLLLAIEFVFDSPVGYRLDLQHILFRANVILVIWSYFPLDIF